LQALAAHQCQNQANSHPSGLKIVLMKNEMSGLGATSSVASGVRFGFGAYSAQLA
jgi:hypothetical protein